MSNHFYPQKFYVQKFHFSKILSHFILFYFIIFFIFFLKKFCDEQCPISDSETVLSPKTWSKLSQVHKAPNLAQPVHTGAPRCARVAVSWRPQPTVSQAPSAVSQAPAGLVVGAGRRVSGAPLVVSWLGCVVLRHSPASNSPPLVTIHLGVL